MIVAVSTRPSRQNRSTCSPMSVTSAQKQKLYPLPVCRTLEGESGEMCDLLHTSNHHYFDGDNKGPLSDGRHRLGQSHSHSGGALVGKTGAVEGRG
jgi:hypothetical protein